MLGAAYSGGCEKSMGFATQLGAAWFSHLLHDEKERKCKRYGGWLGGSGFLFYGDTIEMKWLPQLTHLTQKKILPNG